ncbi:hypothetical protein NPIL_422881 [Nephila pilipes]|uniref:Uncharacterized protein n=1 Tax=Nephila pilipes TaxID=299642 RepID=A0A8X6MIU6_NEPPI|nr:hypothetical protein NPIL_422881 [Nephila pilipes]
MRTFVAMLNERQAQNSLEYFHHRIVENNKKKKKRLLNTRGSGEEQKAKPSQEERRREELNLQTSEGGGLSLIEVPVTTFHKSSPAAHLGKGKGGNNARKGNGARGAYHPRKWKEGYSGRPNPAMRKESGNFLSH